MGWIRGCSDLEYQNQIISSWAKCEEKWAGRTDNQKTQRLQRDGGIITASMKETSQEDEPGLYKMFCAVCPRPTASHSVPISDQAKFT